MIPRHSYRMNVYDWDRLGPPGMIGYLDVGLPSDMASRLNPPRSCHTLHPPPHLPWQPSPGRIEIVAPTKVLLTIVQFVRDPGASLSDISLPRQRLRPRAAHKRLLLFRDPILTRAPCAGKGGYSYKKYFASARSKKLRLVRLELI